ncbi:MAG TPA: Rrf2 family transcriptional regulator [Methylomirabilota bacterium]|jgi:Rrf2 family transcriptional regulator, cysteine metabolism repressor|nr:Rrf2 family transcriptional regulator [Methylomirabilota bacterium]
MRISAKGDYAVKAMLDLAMHRGRPLVPIQEIAARQSIPQRYLEQVLLSLKRAGLLTSKRGSTGGYHLTKSPDEITVGVVLRAVEGSSAPFEGGPTGRRRGSYDEELAALWDEIGEAVAGVVDRWTLGDLVARAEQRRGSARPMYHI